MRIALLGNCHGLGGGPTHYRLLADFLVAEGHDLRTVAVADPNDTLPEGVPRKWMMRLRSTAERSTQKFAKALEFLRAAASLKAHRPELFIAVGYGGSYPRFAQLIGNECFRFYHELFLSTSRDSTGEDRVRQSQIRTFDAVAVQSPSMVTGFKAATTLTKPVRSLPCFGLPPLDGWKVPSRSAGERTLRFAFFGRLEANKGLAPFLDAYDEASQSMEASLDIHGSGSETGAILNKITQLQLKGRVRLCGRYPDGEEYARLLCSYDAIVLPSIHSEGLPLVLLEAMGYGLPFLSTRIGAIADAAIDNPDAFIVEPTTAGLAKGMCLLAAHLREGRSDPQRQRRHYREHFSAEVMRDRWREMLVAPRQFFMKDET